jgi:hypothetical protein
MRKFHVVLYILNYFFINLTASLPSHKRVSGPIPDLPYPSFEAAAAM